MTKPAAGKKSVETITSMGDAVNAAENLTAWQNTVPTGILKPVAFGFLVIAVFILGFGIWAVGAPISGAAIASGRIIASGKNQAIQHLEGGIIQKISVTSGEAVKQDQPLVHLQKTQAESNRNRVEKTVVSLMALVARASAELEGSDNLVFAADLIDRAGGIGNNEVLSQQKSEFISKLQRQRSELGVLDERIKAVEEEISGIKLQISAEETKLVVIKDELEAKKTLLDKGLTPKSLYNQLLREQADIVGRIGGLSATIGQRRISISEVREQQATLRATRKAKASAELNQAQPQIEDFKEQLNSRSDILERMIIRAPIDGIVVDIEKNTIGGIVRPGETILEILPTSSELVISVRVMPQDVDIITVGQDASVRFVALNTRTTPEVPAAVEYISADRLIDPVTHEAYFDARLKLASKLPDTINPEQLYPGMPVDAFIKTGDRTFLEYLVRPIQDSFNKAFREE